MASAPSSNWSSNNGLQVRRIQIKRVSNIHWQSRVRRLYPSGLPPTLISEIGVLLSGLGPETWRPRGGRDGHETPHRVISQGRACRGRFALARSQFLKFYFCTAKDQSLGELHKTWFRVTLTTRKGEPKTLWMFFRATASSLYSTGSKLSYHGLHILPVSHPG